MRRAQPVFVDMEPNTASIDPKPIEDAVAPCTGAILSVLEESGSMYRRT